MTDPESDFLTIPQAADLAGVAERTITKWIDTTKVSFTAGPRGRLVNRASLESWLEQRARRPNGQSRPIRVRSKSDPGPPADPALLTDLLAEVKALRREIADLRSDSRALLAPGSAPRSEPAPAPKADQGPPVGPRWRRWLDQWIRGRP
jgi:excisionase family DNA binding protein